MKLNTTLVIILLASILTSCGKKQIEDATEPTEVATPGNADIVLTAGSSTFKLSGTCGWASAAGKNYIGATHGENNLRVFAAFFNINELPAKTTTYTLVESLKKDSDPTHVSMSLSQISGGSNGAKSKYFGYSTSNSSGKLTLVVEGNKVTTNLAGIIMQPALTNPIYESENIGDFAKPAIFSGTLTFYRK